jgi:hypothetical protein
MKEFRVAPCLVEGSGVFDFAIFADGTPRSRILEDEKYGKYFYARNDLNKDEEGTLRAKRFTGRIKDALDTVKNGNGDAIWVETEFGGKIIRVSYFLDRKTGEEVRKKTLEGWKDTKISYVVKFYYKNSMFGSDHVCTTEDSKPIQFESYASAKEWLDTTLKDAINQVIAKITKYNTSDERLNALNSLYKEAVAMNKDISLYEIAEDRFNMYMNVKPESEWDIVFRIEQEVITDN